MGGCHETDNETASGRPLHVYEDIAAELELIAEMVRNTPGLNHDAAERLPKVAQDIRSDLDRLGKVLTLISGAGDPSDGPNARD